MQTAEVTQAYAMRDADLHLIEPGPASLREMSLSLLHPAVRRPRADVSEIVGTLQRWVRDCPRGRRNHGAYEARDWWMKLTPRVDPALPIVGAIELRAGDVDPFEGHVGYAVFKPARGRGLAYRACRLILPVARELGLRELVMTCDPDNAASRRTIEKLGGELIDIAPLPEGHKLRSEGSEEVARFRVNL